jgi:chromosome transmission fidelity protein 1
MVIFMHRSSSINVTRLEKNNSTSSDADEPTCKKIFYASRTHSQLAQVLHELRKLKLSDPIPELDCSEEDDYDKTGARVVSLASRKQLCINEKLQQSAGDLDEKCRELLSGEDSPNPF